MTKGTNLDDAIMGLQKSEKFRKWGRLRLRDLESSSISKEVRREAFLPRRTLRVVGSQHRDHPIDFPRRARGAQNRQDRDEVQTRLCHFADSPRSRGTCPPEVVGVMLNAYRRHSPSCPHQSREYNRCRCRIWYDWNIDGRRITKPIGTRDWPRAQQLAREMEAEGRVLDPNGKTVSVEKACDDFLADAKARGLRESSLYKYELLLTRLKTFAAEKGLTFISHFDVDTTAKFRESWTNKGTSARKKLESLRTFFTFCHDRNWIESNPAKKLKMGKNEEPPIEPFTKEQVASVLAAIAEYPDKQNAVRLRALILLLRYSALRIGDAVTLDRSRIENGRLFLRTAKTGTRVFVPLPKASLDALDACPHERTPFWTGESKRKSVIGNWQRAMKKLFKLAKVPDGHPHRFRHTFAAELLMSGTALTNVAQLLGHSSEKITEKHYSAWIKGRQERLETDVRKAFRRISPPTPLQRRYNLLSDLEKPAKNKGF
jgi:integrase/recombinase XerD